MPATFFAHQGPVLPIQRRWPRAFDGLALMIGTMSPDFPFVLHGSRFSVWVHNLPGIVLFCTPAGVLVAWLVARVIAPVGPSFLPRLGSFQLRDYRGLAMHRFGWVRTPLSAAIGALTHVLLDHPTHGWGWFARRWPWYGEPRHRLLGRAVSVAVMMQLLAHVVLSAWCVVLLWRLGRQRWMADRARQVPLVHSATLAAVWWGCTLAGLAAFAGWRFADPSGQASAVLRAAACTFAGMLVGSIVVTLLHRRRRGVTSASAQFEAVQAARN